jgi:hypothetical protein
MMIGAVASEAMLFLPRKHADAIMNIENACAGAGRDDHGDSQGDLR